MSNIRISSHPYKVGKISWKNISPSLPACFTRDRDLLRVQLAQFLRLICVPIVCRRIRVKVGITIRCRM